MLPPVRVFLASTMLSFYNYCWLMTCGMNNSNDVT